MNSFTLGSVTASISRDPVRPLAADTSLFQQTGLDSAGNRYVTDRSGLSTRPVSLIFPHISGAELESLKTFLTVTVAGSRFPFTWTDNLGGAHDMRLTSWRWIQVTPAWYRVELNMEETV